MLLSLYRSPGLNLLSIFDGVQARWARAAVEARPEELPPPASPLLAVIREAALALYEAAGAPAPAGLSTAWAGGEVPLARGLGASACGRVGGHMAANALLGGPPR